MKLIKDIFTPHNKSNSLTTNTITWTWIIGSLIIWSTINSVFIPSIGDIFTATKSLFTQHNFFQELVISTWLCVKSILIASVISLIIAYSYVLPIMKPFVSFVAKSRFLTTIGLTFIFAQMTPDVGTQKISLLVFGITVFLVTSFISIIASVTKDELDHARTLKMNEWEVLFNVIILGKADQFFEMIKQNFSIAWMMLVMVENLARSEGGIGVILYNQNKHFHLDSVYAVQIIVLLLGLFFDWLLGKMKVWLFPYSVLQLERK